MANGPLVVEGDVDVVGIDGAPLEVAGPTVLLCRCGGSGRKPFCDGTHGRNGFRS